MTPHDLHILILGLSWLLIAVGGIGLVVVAVFIAFALRNPLDSK